MTLVSQYEPGDVVRFTRGIVGAPGTIRRGTIARVVEVTERSIGFEVPVLRKVIYIGLKLALSNIEHDPNQSWGSNRDWRA